MSVTTPGLLLILAISLMVFAALSLWPRVNCHLGDSGTNFHPKKTEAMGRTFKKLCILLFIISYSFYTQTIDNLLTNGSCNKSCKGRKTVLVMELRIALHLDSNPSYMCLMFKVKCEDHRDKLLRKWLIPWRGRWLASRRTSIRPEEADRGQRSLKSKKKFN